MVAAHPWERVFVSGSRDGTARVWAPQAAKSLGVYTGHRESVAFCHVMSSRDWVATSDAEVHVWDVEVLQRLYTYKANLSSGHVAAFTASYAAQREGAQGGLETCVLGASGKYPGPVTIKLYDLRAHDRGMEWHLPPSVNNVCIMTHGHGLLWCGTVTGQLAALDLRSGVIQSVWQAHEGAISGISSRDSARDAPLISTSVDRTMAVWSSTAHGKGEEEHTLWSEPTLSPWGEGESQGRLHLTDGIVGITKIGGRFAAALAAGVVLADPPSDVQQSRLRSIRSNITAIAALPYSRLLLVGCEDGRIRACY